MAKIGVTIPGWSFQAGELLFFFLVILPFFWVIQIHQRLNELYTKLGYWYWYIYIYYVHVCVYVYIYGVHIYVYIHTYIHTYPSSTPHSASRRSATQGDIRVDGRQRSISIHLFALLGHDHSDHCTSDSDQILEESELGMIVFFAKNLRSWWEVWGETRFFKRVDLCQSCLRWFRELVNGWTNWSKKAKMGLVCFFGYILWLTDGWLVVSVGASAHDDGKPGK